MLSYSTPWRDIYELWPAIVSGGRGSQHGFAAGLVSRMDPPPLYEGLQNIPDDSRFVLCPNHFQRKAMWIAHPASAITCAMAAKYGSRDPVVHWLVTANWPPWKIGPWTVRSPGDVLLPRVAHALWCYPIALVGTDPAYTARSIRKLLRDLPSLDRPLGIFPEGAAGVAGRLSDPLPGMARLLAMVAKAGWSFVPVGISEAGRLVIRFGGAIGAMEMLAEPDAARRVMAEIARLV